MKAFTTLLTLCFFNLTSLIGQVHAAEKAQKNSDQQQLRLKDSCACQMMAKKNRGIATYGLFYIQTINQNQQEFHRELIEKFYANTNVEAKQLCLSAQKLYSDCSNL